MIKAIYTILLLICSNIFMTLAWYGHLHWNWIKNIEKKTWIILIIISWFIAFFEYCFQVPANKIGFQNNGGPFNLFQLKILQEVISIIVFILISTFAFKNQTLKWNHVASFVCIIFAVYFVFKK